MRIGRMRSLGFRVLASAKVFRVQGSTYVQNPYSGSEANVSNYTKRRFERRFVGFRFRHSLAKGARYTVTPASA